MTPTTTTTLCFLALAFYGIRSILRRIFSTLDSVPGPASKSIITGNLSQFHDLDDWGFQQELEENYGRVVKLHGFLGDRHLFVFDPVALHHILVKDQDVYEEMPKFLCLDLLVFGRGIFSTMGDDHRKYRKTMMPAFSTLNLRGVVPLFYEVAERVGTLLPQQLDFNSISCRTSLELIGRTGIGYSFDPMLPGQEQTDRYARALRGLFVTAFKLQLFIPLLPILMNLLPPALRRFLINFIPSQPLHELRDLVDLTDSTAAQLVKDRKMAQEGGKLDGSEEGKDIMSLLGMHLADDELVACLSMILFAATDTTSSSMNRMIHLLALNPEVQHKLREEVLTAPEHLDYDKIDALPYLDGFVREILRLYPPVPVMFREAMSDITLPLSTPIIGSDGTIMHTIAVPKGTSIYVGLAAANHDKSIWGEDALEFKPDRWTKGKADSVETKLPGIYGNTMTFLGGGRSCIGFKFAQLEMKVVVCVLLRSFSFSKPDSGIRWRKTGIMPSPYVNDEPKLPIVVERLRA
ncbi:cytochrome P450 [Mycena metata]|uniref:Cytochrome P450 n=1 Tax=Mycena metata TaxID=1033252 RepID=A0AAD7GPQ7_9AGAR|nr:cytochrome P450 [Mycena metata]